MSQGVVKRCPNCGIRQTPGGFCPACGEALSIEPSPSDDLGPTRPRARKVLVWLVAASVLLGVVVAGGFAYALTRVRSMSAAQEEVIEQLGPPPRFLIAYVPRTEGSSEELVRTEVWYYPDHQQSISFVEGAIASVETIAPDPEGATYPDLRPEAFDFEMGYEEVAALLGGDIQKVEELPDLSSKDGIELYEGDHGMFAIERGKLVYLQTIGLGPATTAATTATTDEGTTGSAEETAEADTGSVQASEPGEGAWLYPVFIGTSWGYVDKTGKVVVQPRFQSADPMSEGLAAASDAQGRFGYVDATGKTAIRPQFQIAGAFHDGLAVAMSRERTGYVDTAGKWAIEPRFAMAGDFGEGLAPATDGNGLWGYVDRTGTFVLKQQYGAADAFSEGLAAVRVGDSYGYIDTKGRSVIAPKLTSAGLFRDGLAPASTGDRTGYIDTKGSFVLPQRFLNAYPFSEGLAGVAVEEGVGFIDKTGAWVIEPVYEDVGPFAGGVAAAWKDGKVGYIDKAGAWVYKPGETP